MVWFHSMCLFFCLFIFINTCAFVSICILTLPWPVIRVFSWLCPGVTSQHDILSLVAVIMSFWAFLYPCLLFLVKLPGLIHTRLYVYMNYSCLILSACELTPAWNYDDAWTLHLHSSVHKYVNLEELYILLPSKLDYNP